MPRNVIITPASGLIDFKDDAGNIDAFIQLDGSGNLNISNSGGNLSLGNTATDVYIGDGVNSVDIIFEQNGDIRALAGRTLTLGQSDSNITVASPTIFTSTSSSTSTTTGALKVSGGAGIAGTLNAASIRINNSYTLPTADGASSYVVATNGTGQLSFVDVNTIVVQTLNLSTNQDFGLLTENYTQSVNLGLVTEGFSTSYDWGVIATGGIVYPNQLVLPYYTVAQLPSSEIVGQLIFISNESGGAVPAFSDGTNWRRVTDRVIVS